MLATGMDYVDVMSICIELFQRVVEDISSSLDNFSKDTTIYVSWFTTGGSTVFCSTLCIDMFS